MIARISLALSITAGLACAQTKTFDLPSINPIPRASNFPFAGPKMRYQQWYSAAEFLQGNPNPMRVVAIDFKAGSPGGQSGQAPEIEVTMANSSPFQMGGQFEGNMFSGRTVVLPRTRIQLKPAAPGSYPVNIPFVNEFVWDGASGVVVDIKMFDNGNNNVTYSYDLESTVASPGRIARMYTVNDPQATFATFGPNDGQGLVTRFQFNEAITVSYGSGCPGDGGFVPVASTSGGLPIPGNTAWTHELGSAPSQRQAFWVFGGSNTLWAGTIPLPHELVEIKAFGCFLRANPVAVVSTQTVGGAPGTGLAKVGLPIPGITSIVGISFYSQWLVLDPLASNGVLTTSQGLRHIVALN